MCGISLTVGNSVSRISSSIIKDLSHRGYDSAGYLSPYSIVKYVGENSIESLIDSLQNQNFAWVLTHNRWGTHGEVSYDNAHPIGTSNLGYIVHNGIINNFNSLKDQFGCHFSTDTSLFLHLINEVGIYKAVDLITGDNIFIYRETKHHSLSPIFKVILTGDSRVFLGWNEESYSICSEAQPLFNAGYSEVVEFSSEKSCCIDSFTLFDNRKNFKKVYGDKEEQKTSSMIEEIEEQALLVPPEEIFSPYDYTLVGCGSSYYAARFISEYFEDEIITHNASLYKDFLKIQDRKYGTNGNYYPYYLFFSQSGESKDVIDCVNLLNKYSDTLCLTNNSSSTLNRICDTSYILDTNCGKEYAVAATKTFMSFCLTFLSEEDKKRYKALIKPALSYFRGLAKVDFDFDKVFFFGSGTAYPIALESALKLMEVANIPAWAMPANEMKHGPIAMVDEKTLCVFVNSIPGEGQEANEEQVKSRGSKAIRLNTGYQYDDEDIHNLLNVIFAQYLSYYQALKKGLNPDRPRNLSKVITV